MVGQIHLGSIAIGLRSDAAPAALEHVSLVGGWLPWTIQLVSGLALVVAISWRTPYWYKRWVPLAIACGGAVGSCAWKYTQFEGIAEDVPPKWVWIWLGLAGAGFGVSIFGFPRARWWQRLASVLSVFLCLLSAGFVLNRWVLYWPTAQMAWNDLTDAPLPNEVDAAKMLAMQRTHSRPAHGTIVRLESGSEGSHFSHRQEYVYLPPAWYSSSPPPPLPVVLMLAGEFGRPTSWLLGGGAYTTIDNFALEHRGFSPIFVFSDVTGLFRNDTECVNGPRGYAADHLTKDVAPSVIKQFGASNRAANWGIAGWSMGGTCAVDLTVMHPDIFTSFIDIQGDQGPSAGTRGQTIARLFGGNLHDYEAFDPLSVMKKHGPYVGVTALFIPPMDSAVDDASRKSNERQRAAAMRLCGVGQRLAIACAVRPFGGPHTLHSGTLAFAAALPWLASQIGTPEVEKVSLPTSEPLPLS